MSSGNTLPRIITGCMKWGQWGAAYNRQQYLFAMEHAIDLGAYAFDHADIYGDYTTEAEFGEALALQPHLREKMILITKCGIQLVGEMRPSHRLKSYNTSASHIISSAERSLLNLRTDYLDYLLIHRPDPLMDADEIAAAFMVLKEQGKVLQFGVSNFNPQQFELINSRFPLVTNQVEASIVHLQPFTDGVLDMCQLKGIIPMAWSPVGGGNIFTATDERSLRILEVADALSEKYGMTSDQVLLNWLLLHPARIHPVLGTSRVERIRTAMETVKLNMEREDWFMLWTASTGHRVL